MAPHIGTKSAQNCPNIDPISDHSNPGQIEGHIWHKIGPICDQELAQSWPTPVPGWSWARNRPEMWPVSGTKMVPDLPYFNPQYWYISCSDLETKSHLDRNTLMDVTCPNSWKTHIFLSLGQHPVDRIPPTHKQPGIPHIRLSIFIAVHKNLPDPSYFNLRDPHTHDVRNSEQFRK